MKPEKILMQDYTYNLPEERIARYPLENRDASKLLVNKGNSIKELKFKNIAEILPQDSLMFFNNTKVVQARLELFKETGARIEIFCLSPLKPSDYAMAFQSTGSCKWECIVGNLKKWKNQTLTKKIVLENKEIQLKATKCEAKGDKQVIEFSWNNKDIVFGEILENAGKTPIPPYLRRNPEEMDKKRYQTVYSKFDGSVAAPTAGLHFTNYIMEQLAGKNITPHEVTLHVGAGTFQPVKSESIAGHDMHSEHFSVHKRVLEAIYNNPKNLTAVGTTTTRTLESLYWLGVKVKRDPGIAPGGLKINQWDPYKEDHDISLQTSLEHLIAYMEKHQLENIHANTQIIIVPGYKFKIVKNLITNFHQPQSTLLLLIAAFCGQKWKSIYQFALNNKFRFLSYGDSSFLQGVEQ